MKHKGKILQQPYIFILAILTLPFLVETIHGNFIQVSFKRHSSLVSEKTLQVRHELGDLKRALPRPEYHP